MGVASLTSVAAGLRQTFSHNFVRHVLIFANFAGRLLELRHPATRMVMLRELAKVFEAAVEAGLAVDCKVAFRQVPLLPGGVGGSPVDLSLQQAVDGDEGSVRVNGELVSVDDPTAMRQKLTRVYERACAALRLPENLSFTAILVGWLD